MSSKMKSKEIMCPSCNKGYTTKCGLKKHLLGEHQLVFLENSNQTRSLSAAELQNAMSKRWRGQHYYERNVMPAPSNHPRLIPKIKILKPVGETRVALRFVPALPVGVRDSHTPPMPSLFSVNNLSTAQWEAYPLPDTLSVHSGDINLFMLDRTLLNLHLAEHQSLQNFLPSLQFMMFLVSSSAFHYECPL